MFYTIFISACSPNLEDSAVLCDFLRDKSGEACADQANHCIRVYCYDQGGLPIFPDSCPPEEEFSSFSQLSSMEAIEKAEDLCWKKHLGHWSELECSIDSADSEVLLALCTSPDK